MRRMEAQGPVTVVSKDQIGTGDSGVYDKAENKVILTGHVTLSQGANVTKGERLVYDLGTKQAVVLGGTGAGGRVRSVFTPNEKSAARAPQAKANRDARARRAESPRNTRRGRARGGLSRRLAATNFAFPQKSATAPALGSGHALMRSHFLRRSA